jgi:hypothetical protein
LRIAAFPAARRADSAVLLKERHAPSVAAVTPREASAEADILAAVTPAVAAATSVVVIPEAAATQAEATAAEGIAANATN